MKEDKEIMDAAEPRGDFQLSQRRRRIRTEMYDWIQSLVTALLFCVIVFVFFARIIGVVGPSMMPTLHERDKIVISSLFYTPRQGDVVVFRKESFRYEPLVKRIIATEGQKVEMNFDKGTVTVDGVTLQEDYINEQTRSALDFDQPVIVPPGQVFVLGDNRNYSTDSRDDKIGMVDSRYIMGKVFYILLPFNRFGSVY